MNPKIGTKFLRGHLHTSEQRLRWLQKSLTKLEQRQQEGFTVSPRPSAGCPAVLLRYIGHESKDRYQVPSRTLAYVGTETTIDRKSTRLNSSHLGISYA